MHRGGAILALLLICIIASSDAFAPHAACLVTSASSRASLGAPPSLHRLPVSRTSLSKQGFVKPCLDKAVTALRAQEDGNDKKGASSAPKIFPTNKEILAFLYSIPTEVRIVANVAAAGCFLGGFYNYFALANANGASSSLWTSSIFLTFVGFALERPSTK
mmetsp:Transcript_39407/g.93287  ORF Transcript_39407/g.93287 Transcript_39407/m.93287 type:complete len:161 (-) Transcript_39407:156-638(-)